MHLKETIKVWHLLPNRAGYTAFHERYATEGIKDQQQRFSAAPAKASTYLFLVSRKSSITFRGTVFRQPWIADRGV